MPDVKELLTRNRRDIWSLSNYNRNRLQNHLVCKRTLNDLALLETPKIHSPFSCKSWRSTKICRLEILETLWFNPNMEIQIQYSISQTREMWDSLDLSRGDFWMNEGSIVFYVFIFVLCLETTVSENNWMRTTNNENQNYLIITMFKGNYEAIWQRHLKDTLQLKILRTWINIGVELAPIHLIYYFTFLFLSNKPTF